MKFRTKFFARCVSLLWLLVFSLTAFANHQSFNQIIFFGDSLSDNGNLYSRLFGFIPKSPPYFSGRFSNGPTWAEGVADHYAQTEKMISANFAVGSETTVFHNPVKGYLPYTLSMSVSDYLWRYSFSDKSQTLFVVWIGANDYLNGSSDIDGDTTAVVEAIKQNIQKLISYGAKQFLLMNLPDLAKTPFGQAQPYREQLTLMTEMHNNKLIKIVQEIQEANRDVTIKLFDFSSEFAGILADPDAYNQKYKTHLSDFTESCWKGGYSLQRMTAVQRRDALMAEIHKNKAAAPFAMSSAQFADMILRSPALSATYEVGLMADAGDQPCDNQDDHIFWDKVHPTRVVHTIFSAMAIGFIDANYA